MIVSLNEPAIFDEVDKCGVNKAILSKVCHQEHPLASEMGQGLDDV